MPTPQRKLLPSPPAQGAPVPDTPAAPVNAPHHPDGDSPRSAASVNEPRPSGDVSHSPAPVNEPPAAPHEPRLPGMPSRPLRLSARIVRALLTPLLSALAMRMTRRADPERIRAYLRRLGYPAQIPSPTPQDGLVRVAVVQQELRILATPEAYAQRMHAFVQQAAAQGAQLVCFPEENGTLLLGQIPGLGLLARLLERRAPASMHGAGAPAASAAHAASAANAASAASAPNTANASQPPTPNGGLDVPFVLSFFSPFLRQSFETVFAELARGFGMHIMAGSLLMVDAGRLVNRAYLFTPDGVLLGTQDKAHPVDLEMSWGLACTEQLRVFDTPLARLALPVCMDATYFETFKILQRLGAQIVIIPIANMEPYEEALALRGIWPRVQESGVYGLKSALVGHVLGMEFTGKAGIFAPLALTADGSGVIAEAPTPDQDAVITVTLDLTRLAAYTSPYFSDTNPALYAKYFPQIYENIPPRP